MKASMTAKPVLHTASSWDSCDSYVYDFMEGPPSRKRKGFQPEHVAHKRMCESSPEGSEICSSDTRQGWESPVKDMDLTASDSLDEAYKTDDVCAPHRNASFSSLVSEGSSIPSHLISDLDATASEQPAIVSPSKSGHFMPKIVPNNCLVARTAELYGYTPYMVSVGTSYFQRLAAVDPVLKQAAQGCRDFAPFVRDIQDNSYKFSGKPIGAIHRCQGDSVWLMAVHLTCINLAAKIVEAVPYANLLQTMLHRLHRLNVSRDQAEDLEAQVLVALEFRLGPYFLPTDL